MNKKVIIYTQETCPPCHAEKQWLKDLGVPFEERDIRKNQQYLQELIDLGASATPVTLVLEENEKDIVFGFDKEKLSNLLHV